LSGGPWWGQGWGRDVPTIGLIAAEIFLPPTSGKPRRSFRAQVFRGHLERPPREVLLGDVTVQIKRVVHGHEFRPDDKRAENLEYILFGTPDELFLAHRIVTPADFDQLLPVRVPDQQILRFRLKPRAARCRV
jgi:hypothetical protein